MMLMIRKFQITNMMTKEIKFKKSKIKPFYKISLLTQRPVIGSKFGTS